MKRTPLRRRTPLRQPRPKQAYDPQAWREGLGPCVVCTELGIEAPPYYMDAHHCIPAQALRRRGYTAEQADKRNRISLCRWHHERHHSRTNPVPRRLLPDSVFEFAAELGLGYLVDRYYPEEDS